MRLTYEPLFKQYGVDVAINGHDHAYDRSYPTCVLLVFFLSLSLFLSLFSSPSFFLSLFSFSVSLSPASSHSAHDIALSCPPLSVPSTQQKNRFDNAVDLTCGTTHLTLGAGGADDLTLGYIDQVLGEKNPLGYYKTQYCNKGERDISGSSWI